MALTIGIVGLPNVGKSTLFNALTKNDVLAANYPFATIEPNVGVVNLPDPRLTKLAEIFGSERILPATVSFVDIAGIVRGASEGEGLGNQFLANIRDEGVPWVARLTEIMHGSNAEQLIADGGPRVADPFGTLERREWAWTRRMSRQAVLDMVHSRSYVITAEPEERARIEREVAEHLAQHPSPEPDGTIDMPYVTHAFRAVLDV